MHALIDRLRREPLYALLALVLLLGVAIRIWGAFSDGFPDDDMAYYTIFAEYYRGLIFDRAAPYFGLDIAYKPGFMVLAFLSVLILGSHDYTLIILNAVLSVGVGLATFAIARMILRSVPLAVVAVAMVTFAPPLLEVDRRGLTHTAATLFVLISVYYFLRFAQQRWNGSPTLLYKSGIFLGVAFLCHPTIILYVMVLMPLALYRVVLGIQWPWSEKVSISVRYGLLAAAPLLVVDAVYRIIFAIWPVMQVGHLSSIIGKGYLSDAASGLSMATISGEGTRSRTFAIDALAMFRTDSAGKVILVLVLASSFYLLWRAVRERRDFFVLLVVVAWFPMLMMAYNPFVGQLARALHATYPLFAVIIVAAAGMLLQSYAERISGFAFTDRGVAVVFVSLIVAAGAFDFAVRYRQVQSSPHTLTSDMQLPRHIFGTLSQQGIKGVYVMRSGFYGMQWFYYLGYFFGSAPFVVQTDFADRPASIRMIESVDTIRSLVDGGQAEIVVMRKMDPYYLRLWDNSREGKFIEFAEQRKARRVTNLGPYHPLPENVFVYDFRQ